MGETTCLMQPFSYAAGSLSINDAKEGNPFHVLGQSVSFGRFVSESLAWERWPTFSNNRYVEEAKKFSRPGSVAEKKALFEAHYKNLAARKAAAAALLEQANTAAKNVAEAENGGGVDHENTGQDLKAVTADSQLSLDKQEDGAKEMKTEASFFGEENRNESNSGLDKLESNKLEEVDPLTDKQVLVETPVKVESLNKLDVVYNKDEVKEMELSGTKLMQKPLLKDFIANKDDLAPISKKKTSSKALIYSKGSTLPSSPAKPAASIRARKENNATPMSKKPGIDSMDRKNLTPKSTYKSMNFTPVRELNRITSSIIRKIDGSRAGSNAKAFRVCPTPLRTPTTISMLGEPKPPLGTPLSENGRAKTPLHPSASGSKTVRSKWHFLPTDCSKFMSACRNKPQSPNLSTPFSLRTEERAARRKKKLEEKFNANQAQKGQSQVTLKKKAETEFRKLRQSLCFKARPLPSFYKERTRPKSEMEKVPLTQSESSQLEKTPALNTLHSSTSKHHSSQPLQRSSSKNSTSKHVTVKNSQHARSLTSQLKTITRKNTSPNIQHD